MKVVICDDDATLRTVIGKLATGLGYEVLAETDAATDAVELVARFGADVLVLDIALPWGSGIAAVHELRDKHSPCQVVIFTSYGADDPEVRGANVRAVVEKPDFDRLEHVLQSVLTGANPDGEGAGVERRKPVPHRPLFPGPVGLSPSGIEEPASFQAAVDALEPGDAILVVRVEGIDAAPHLYGRVLVADRLLAVARSLRQVLRLQDRMTLGDDQHELVALLLHGGRPGVESVWRRLEQAHDTAGDTGILSAGWSVYERSEPTALALNRAREAALRSVGQQPGDRLWAG